MSQQQHHAQDSYHGLVFTSTHLPAQNTISHINTAIPENSWQHHSPPNSSSSSQSYSLVNRSADHVDFVSPTTSPSFMQNHEADPFSIHHSPSVPTGQSLALSLTQVEADRVVPGRILTRSRRRELRGETTSLQSGIVNDTQNVGDQQMDPTYYVADSISRPQTPNNFPDPNRRFPQNPADRLSLTMGPNALPNQLQSPRYPSTPASASPAYSSYGFYHSARAASNPASNPRSASPALSVASALTSISSSSHNNPHQYNPYPSLPPESPRQKHKKQRLTNIDRKDICVYAMNHGNARQEDIANHFKVERSTVSKILKNKHKWLNIPEGEELRVAKHRPSKFPEVEALLVDWLLELKQSGSTMLLSDAVIRQKGKDIAKSLNIVDEKFKASSGWVENFKSRQGIKRGVWQGGGKHIRMARAMGAGTLPHVDRSHDPSALSPLNPAFESRLDGVNNGESSLSHMDNDAGVESEDDESPPLNGHQGHGPALSSDSVLQQPEWHTHPQTVLPDSSVTTSYAHHDNSNIHLASMTVSSHQSIHDSEHQPEIPTEGQTDASAAYDTASLELYQPVPPITSSGIPSMPEVEDAINRVIAFVDTREDGFITWEEREALGHIKNAIFQAASGIPYIREKR